MDDTFKIQYRCKRCDTGLTTRQNWYCDKCLKELFKMQNKAKQL